MSIKSLVLLLFASLILVSLSTSVAATNSTNTTNATNTTVNVTSALSKLMQQEIQAYLKTGEQYTTISFNSSGVAYTLVIVNTQPAMIIDPSLNVISDAPTLSLILPDYIKGVKLPFNAATLANIKANVNSVNSSFAGCVEDYYEFLTNIQVCYDGTFNKFLCSYVYQEDLSQALNISENFSFTYPAVNTGTAGMNQSLINMFAATANLNNDVSTTNLGLLSQDLSALSTDTANFSAGYAIFQSGHSLNIQYLPFATEGGLSRCVINTTAVANVQSVTAVASQLPNQTQIIMQIGNFITSRSSGADVTLLGNHEAALLSVLQATLTSVDAAYSKETGSGLTGLDAQFVTLENQSVAVGSASNITVAQALALKFNASLNSLVTGINSAQANLPALTAAIAAGASAKANLSAASQRLGPGDAQTQALTQQYNQYSSQLRVMQSNLQDGNPTTPAALANVTANLNAVSSNAASAQPKQNQIDPLLFAGVIILVVLLVGGFLLLKKFKKQGGDEKPIEQFMDKK